VSEPVTSREQVASELCDWFGRIQRLTELSAFAGTPPGPHRTAAILHVLAANARLVREADIDRSGALYSPLCLLLTAACRKLDVSLGVGQWLAAIANVVALCEQVGEVREESKLVGLELGTPARFVKQQLDEALLASGLAGPPSFLDKADREIALGLAVNWGIRFLLAYGLECEDLQPVPERQDLAWVAGLLRPLQASRTEIGAS
jgi:hypothetical protein